MSETTIVGIPESALQKAAEEAIADIPGIDSVKVTVGIPEGAAPLAEVEPQLDPDETGAAPAFDPTPYNTAIPKVDGIYAEKIVIGFSGSIELDMADENNLALFNNLTLGKDVVFQIGGTVSDRMSPLREDKEGSQSMIRKAKVAVHTLYLSAPEDL